MRALISVSDKTGIVDFAKKLESLGVEIISTGGSEKRLIDSGIKVSNVSQITNFPECLDGRVKTLHPAVHAGILAKRDNKEHITTLNELNIQTIDILVINLYPFKETILKDNVTLEQAIENIDIGGPTMLRAGAKNYKDVTVLTDFNDYDLVYKELLENGKVSIETNKKLAAKVFLETAYYDTLIANYLAKTFDVKTPQKLTLAYDLESELRYGENPHQKAAFYKDPLTNNFGVSGALQVSGKELSYNNINDANGAINLLSEFENEIAVVAVKHSSPCGVGVDIDLYGAYKKAYECDPLSIFGGIVATNQVIDEKTARKMNEIFLEVIIAKGYTETAFNILSQKKNLRLLTLENATKKDEKTYKKVTGGILVQDTDLVSIDDSFEVVTERIPTKTEISDMIFAMKVCKHTNSNGIVFAKNNKTISIGGGQVSRVFAVESCINHKCESALGAVLASDAFFPFRDSIDIAAKEGIKAIIQPGGSIRDEECIKACNEYGIAMVFTGKRHFKH